MFTELDCIVMYLEFNPTRYINKDNWKHIMKYSPQSDVHRTEGRKLFSRKNNMLTNHDSNRNRNMSRIDEGKESETNEDKQKNEVQDAFTTLYYISASRNSCPAGG